MIGISATRHLEDLPFTSPGGSLRPSPRAQPR